MTDLAIGNNRSNDYTRLLEELRHSIRSTADIPSKIYEQGKKDGLSPRDIELALEGVIKELAGSNDPCGHDGRINLEHLQLTEL